MQRLTLLTTLALLALAASLVNSHAAGRACDCPDIAVRCADTVPAGSTALFTVAVSNFNKDSKLSYTWTVSAGTVLSGQGTPSITVDTTGLDNQTATATVEVKGLPDSCPRSSSCTTAIPRRIIEDRFDEYGDIGFEDEEARLDNFAIDLLNWPQGKGYIVAYGGRRGRRGEARKRAERAKNYLVTVRGIPANQVVIIDGGYRENLSIVLKLRSQDLPPPQPTPTVDPKDVQFIKDARPRGRRRH
jgi:hypothetical protein